MNFSRPAAQILGQYYQFIRLGFQGYKEVQQNSMAVADYLHAEIGKMAPFQNYSKDVVNPLFIWYLKPDYAKSAKWTLYLESETDELIVLSQNLSGRTREVQTDLSDVCT